MTAEELAMEPAYTFSLCIDHGNRTIVDTSLEVPDTRERITKAKRTIQHLMNKYAPVAKAPTPVPEPAGLNPESQPPADLLPAAETAPTPPPEKKPEGARGLFHLHCKECGRAFTTFLREHQAAVRCKCGQWIDLTAPLARYRFTCPYCEREGWGLTNLEDPDITVPCKCGGSVDLRWAPKSKEYQN